MVPLNDQQIRLAAFDWLTEQTDVHGDVLDRRALEQGFEFQDERVPMMGPQGIWKPRVLPALPLSITSSPKGPYDDAFSYGGLLLYRYRGMDPNHRDNRGLRSCWEGRIPLVYFHGILPGRYLSVWPVFVVEDSPPDLTFSVAIDDAKMLSPSLASVTSDGDTDGRRRYITTSFRQRLHQRTFRERVLQAYHVRQAIIQSPNTCRGSVLALSSETSRVAGGGTHYSGQRAGWVAGRHERYFAVHAPSRGV